MTSSRAARANPRFHTFGIWRLRGDHLNLIETILRYLRLLEFSHCDFGLRALTGPADVLRAGVAVHVSYT
jgi:hypothetical protein